MKYFLFSLLFTFSTLGIEAFAGSNKFKDCTHVNYDETIINSVKTGSQAYCAFRKISHEENYNDSVLKMIGANIFMAIGARQIKAEDLKTSKTRNLERVRDFNQRSTSGPRKAFRWTLRSLKSFGPLALSFLGVALFADALYNLDTENVSRSIEDSMNEYVEAIVPHSPDSSLGPEYLSSPEKLSELFKLDPDYAVSIVNGSPALKRFMLISWEEYQRVQRDY